MRKRQAKAAEDCRTPNLADSLEAFELAKLLECASPLALWQGARQLPEMEMNASSP